ncbi:putative t-diRNAhydrouridine synthase [Paratrimastix pyriformis]|uniref:tRNA-dihydrouridine(16/17) synthase [NAD(P)(+)] n=1 Tax=Paratrimastix pyriformis TaxID=342808 RepID=A0ABQ8UJJ8_9EUKA|nr:putative t-diRNAhydrouridine synthase [Paratrimastix pyriformis]
MEPADAPLRPKLEGFDFWKSIGSPRYVLAPMVDTSELPFRLLCKRYGTELSYSPMLNQNTFVNAPADVRATLWSTCPEERPVFAQIAGDDPERMLQAAKLVENECDAVDVNLGCPQSIARRGNYGAFLQDQWDTVRKIITTLHQHLKVPVTAKFRKQFTLERSIGYAQLLVECGAQVICMHGRTRKQKGILLGVADWDTMRIVRDSIPTTPFISNGSIHNMDDARRCFEVTNCQAVMSGEPIRRNPALFSGRAVPGRQLAGEYLEICKQYPVPIHMIRDHVHRMMMPTFDIHYDLRQELFTAPTIPVLEERLAVLDRRIEVVHRSAAFLRGLMGV